MTHQAKAPSAESTQATGSSRGLFRRAFATRGASSDAKGNGARSNVRLRATRATLAVLALAIAAFAITAAPASADTATCCTVSNVSYAAAHLEGKVTTNSGFLSYRFEYSTDEIDWKTGASGSLGETAVTDKAVPGELTVPQGATKYFVRLSVTNLFGGVNATSPKPYPSFTTLAADPTAVVTVDNASEVAYTTAKATGKIKRPEKSNNVACHFEYIADTDYAANPVGERFAGAAAVGCEPKEFVEATGAEVPVEANLANLANNTIYHLRLAVSNAANADAKEAAQTFTTLAVDPPSVVSTENASAVEYSRAEVKGVVERSGNPDPAFDINGCNFEYVTDAQFKENEEDLSQPGFTGATPVECEVELPITTTGQTPVEAKLTSLSASTTYHLRLAATNAAAAPGTKEAAATFTTQGPVPKPVIIATEDATDITIHEAKVKGEIERPAGADPALDVNCRFEYVTQAQFEAEEFAAAAPNGQIAYCPEPITSPDPGHPSVTATVNTELSGLVPDRTYHFRLVAENGGGIDTKDAGSTFTTLPAELPTVTIDPIEAGIYTAAHVTGTVTLLDGHTGGSQPFAQVSSDGGATWSSFVMLSSRDGVVFRNGNMGGAGNASEEGLYIVKGDVTGLQPSTTYLFRIAASYNSSFTNNPPENIALYEARGEVAFSAAETITTEPPQPAPTAEALAVTGVTAHSAHFSATVDPRAPGGALGEAAKKAFATHWEFVCTPECNNANGNPIAGTVQGEEGAQPVGGDATRLEGNTEYTVSLVVKSEGGEETVVETFHTKLVKPTITAAPGGSDGKGGYTLQGVVNPNGSAVTSCKFVWGPNAPEYAFSADCSPAPGAGSKPVTVEAHLTGLNPGVVYHFNLLATNGAGTEESHDQKFTVTLSEPESCSNKQLRSENNSLALPECRAYEMVTPPGKAGFGAELEGFSGGEGVHYASGSGNIARSGQNGNANDYVAARSATGWETIPDLNGSSGSIFDSPSDFLLSGSGFVIRPERYSSDLLSSLWVGQRSGEPAGKHFYLRAPDGSFSLIGVAEATVGTGTTSWKASADLSHLVVGPRHAGGLGAPTVFGPGVYEFLGTGGGQPRRVDLDNSGTPVSSCIGAGPDGPNPAGNANADSVFADGRVIAFTVHGGCGGANPPADEIWARVDGTTSFDVSASHCTRTAGDPGGICNGPTEPGGCFVGDPASGIPRVGCRDAKFEGAAKDGSRVFFTTTQQLVNGDTDQTNDIYACDIPSGTPAPVGKANPCSAFVEVSGAATGAEVENVEVTSADGDTVLFTAKGVLAADKDAQGEEAAAGDHNLYVWHQDGAHPAGQTSFVGRLGSDDLRGGLDQAPQSTPDGRYLVFTTADPLVPTDTDNARDVYRYEADTGELTRVSTAVSGAGGNGDFDASVAGQGAISDDGQKIAFTTAEALSPADGNAEPDAYLRSSGRVSLISAGSVGSGGTGAAVDGSGQDIYFDTAGALTPADGDDLEDVYDARVGGGFSFARVAPCSGEGCQPASPASPASPANRLGGEGNVKPKVCPKGKVAKGTKCVRKQAKKHKGKHHKRKGHGKHHGKKHGRAGSDHGGGK